uniref:Uncharacterized protein LOC114340701 n=1 Tax=Diabrotica virgifera virgifera TaxID=50390 RepID=A0A6P7GD00_DIAVI
MLLEELSLKQLREQLEEYEQDASGSKKVLKARLEEVLKKNGDDPKTFHFQSAEQAILSKFESVSQVIKDVCRQNDEKFEEVSRTFDKIQKSVDDSKEMLEEKIKQLETMVTSMKVLPSVNAVVLSVEEKIKELESMITDTKVQPSVHAVALDPVVKDELRRDEMSHNMRFKLPPFDGKSSWSIYLRQFEAIATANHWTEQEKAVSLTAALRGDAADILRSIPKGQENCYQTLFTCLEKRYGDAHLQQVYKAQLRSRSQRASENLQEFEADVARVGRVAYPEVPDSVLEEIAVDTFVNGLKDNELQKALRLARPKVLDEALAIALEHETASQTSRGHRVRTIEESDEHNDERLEEMIRRVLSNQMPKRREPRCWNCGDVGHIRRNCKKIVQPSEN